MKIYNKIVNEKIKSGDRVILYNKVDNVPAQTEGTVVRVLPNGDFEADFGEYGTATLDYVKSPFFTI